MYHHNIVHYYKLLPNPFGPLACNCEAPLMPLLPHNQKLVISSARVSTEWELPYSIKLYV